MDAATLDAQIAQKALATFPEEALEFVRNNSDFLLLEFRPDRIKAHRFHKTITKPSYGGNEHAYVAEFLALDGNHRDLMTTYAWQTVCYPDLSKARKVFIIGKQMFPDLNTIQSHVQSRFAETELAFRSRLPAKPFDPFEL